MKRAILIIAIFVLLLLSSTTLSSCVNKDSQNKINNETAEPVVTLNEEKPATGFPSGQLQKEYIFYSGVVWTFDMYNTAEQKLKELPEDFTFVGHTLSEDPYVMPSEDLHTAHIEPGKDVYISTAGDAIYIELKQSIYFRYIPEKSIYPSTPETLPHETDEPESINKNAVYTAEYYSGAYNGYDHIDYEDEERGAYYKETYPNKHFNDNVTIKLEITAELEKTVFTTEDKFRISFTATNVGGPFMFIDRWAGYFDSWLVNTEYILEDGSNYILHNDYYFHSRLLPAISSCEDLIETGEARVDSNPYTVTTDIPSGKYDLYIYFYGYITVVRNALEITNDDFKPASDYVTELICKSEKDYGYTSNGAMWSLDYSLCLPSVNISPEIDEVVNGEITELICKPAVEDIIKKRASFDIDYSVYKNSDIVSLVISKHEGYDISGFSFYCANISLTDKRKLTLAEVADSLGINYKRIISKFENPCEDLFYVNTYGDLILLDYRLESPEIERYMYYAYNASRDEGHFIYDLIK